MARYRKKPVEVDAVQYQRYGHLVHGMCNSRSCYLAGNTEPHVHTIHNNQVVLLEVGDWIIPEPDGEHFYPCKHDIFAATYELEDRRNTWGLSVCSKDQMPATLFFVDEYGDELDVATFLSDEWDGAPEELRQKAEEVIKACNDRARLQADLDTAQRKLVYLKTERDAIVSEAKA